MPTLLILQGFFGPPAGTPTLDAYEDQLALDCLRSFMRDYYARMGITPPRGN